MMFRKLMSVVALAAVATTAASAQEATAVKPLSFGVFAGASVPMGDLADVVKTGYNAGATVGYAIPAWPVSFRVDGVFNQFSGKSGGNLRSINVTGNLVYSIPMQSSVRPYVIGGIGMYNNKPKGGDAENAFGFNAGGGINIPLSGFDTFIEARYNHASKNGGKAQFIPVVFGVKF